MNVAEPMAERKENRVRLWAMAAAVLMAAAIPVGIVWTLAFQVRGPGVSAVGAPDADTLAAQVFRNALFSWIGVIAASLGTVLMAGVALRRPVRPWWIVAGIAPITYVVLVSAPHAASMEFWPVLRLVLGLGAVAAYLPVASSLAGRLQYGVCCSVLAVSGLFFAGWEPPPPTPVPLAKPLRGLETSLVASLNAQRQGRQLAGAWKGEHQLFPKDVEASVGADEYLSLNLQDPDGRYPRVLVYVTYNANAMSNVPHVPWVCMVQSGYNKRGDRQDDLAISAIPGKEIAVNVILFEREIEGVKARALMFQYFNVGGTYTTQRNTTRFLSTTGSLGHTGSYLSQTQVAVWLPPSSEEDPLAKNSGAYRMGVEILNLLVPLLEREHYPNLRQAAGG
jgi:hypothetical protein